MIFNNLHFRNWLQFNALPIPISVAFFFQRHINGVVSNNNKYIIHAVFEG